MTATALDRVTPRWPWVVLPAAGSLWAALALRRSYFFYDEWSMIDRVMHLSAGEGTFASFNGHLWMLQYWLYRLQVSWFGVDDHIFVSVVFVVSLLALHLAITWVLRAAGTPLVTSLLVGGLLTYLGVASQNFIFAVQTSSTLAMAVCLAAAAIVLTRPPSIPSAMAAAILLVLSVGLDSGTALTGLVFATVVMVRTWRSRWALAALPSIVALAWWYLAGDLGPHFPATFGEKASFALHLGLTSIGGLVGQGEIAGAIIAVLSGGAITVGLRRRWITGATATVLLAGTAGSAVVTAGLAQSRAGVVGTDFVNFNRYLQNVALPATIAVVPAVVAVTREAFERWSWSTRTRATELIAPTAVAIAFTLGVAPMQSYSGAFQSWNQAVRQGVGHAAAIIRDDCPLGVPPDPASEALGDLSPQVTTQLLRDLIAHGALHVESGQVASADVTSRMCPTSVAADG